VVALSIPKQYTVKVTLSPEMGNAKGSNGLAGLAASFLGDGALIGESTDALNASLSADIVSSTIFLLELLEMEVSVSKKDDKMTLGSYLDEESSPWWNYVIGFPGMVIGGVKSLFAEEENESRALNRISQGTIELSKKESKKIEILKEMIVAAVDKKTSITSIAVTMQNPRAAAVVADSVVKKLQEYIIDYRITKSKEDCIYLEKLFKERQQEYYSAQQKYADYLDSHDNIILQSVRAEQELAARHGRAVSQVEIRRVLRHDNTPKLSQTEKDDITMKENRKLLREVLKDIRHDMTDEEVLNLLADSKISENPAGEKEKYTLGSSGIQAQNLGNLCHDGLSTHRTKFTIQRTCLYASICKSATTGVTTSTAICLGKHLCYLGNPRIFIHGEFLGSHVKNSGRYQRYNSQ
jgi:hypothetical protein